MARRGAAKSYPLPPEFNPLDYERLLDTTNAELCMEVILKANRMQDEKLTPSKVTLLDLWESANRGKKTINTKILHASHHVYPLEMLRQVTGKKHPNVVSVGVSLIDATDAEILAELKQLLPRWRERLSLPEPKKVETGAIGPSIITRIIEYRLVPMLDLALWADTEEVKYSAEQLSRILFPDQIITAKQMTDTRIPFALKFFESDYQDMVSLWLRQIGADGKSNRDRLVRDQLQ
ncbi:hypothetical protein D3C84_712890 [compost metagenome]